MLMVAVQKIMTTIHFATMLRNATSLLTSRVQLMMTGARATTGTALKQDTMVRPPAPQWGKAAATSAIRYPSSEPAASPITITITVDCKFSAIAPQFS